MKILRVLALAVLIAAPVLAATPSPYHLQLEVDPAIVFPFLWRFGTVTLHVYPAGVRAETRWINGFSRVGDPSFTVENPQSRTYTQFDMREIKPTVRKMSGPTPWDVMPTVQQVATPEQEKIGSLTAKRYRLRYSAQSWIDVWTTDQIPRNERLASIIEEFLGAVSAPTAAAAAKIPGMPLQVELNSTRFHNKRVVRLKAFTRDATGEKTALAVDPKWTALPTFDFNK